MSLVVLELLLQLFNMDKKSFHVVSSGCHILKWMMLGLKAAEESKSGTPGAILE
jgi:hypothetical protein